MQNFFLPKTLTENGINYTGFSLKLNTLESDFKRTVNLKLPGFIIKDNIINEWYFFGFMYKEMTYIYGSFFEGRSLKDILKLEFNQSLPYILNLIKSLKLIRKKIDYDFKIQLDSVFFLDSGEILFLPFDPVSAIRDNSLDEYKTENYCLINNSYLKETDRSLSYTAACLIYKVISGCFPYEGETEDEINLKIRNMKVYLPKMLNFKVKKEISDKISGFFSDKKNLISLDNWENLLETWIEKGIYEELDEVKQKLLEVQSERYKINNSKILKRNVFIEKNSGRISVIGIVSIIIIILFSYILYTATRPKSTKDYTPLQIVETYYKSINSLDTLTLGECLASGVSKSLSDQITYLYVTTKQTQAYENKSYFISADKWVKDGKKDLKPPYFTFGVASLSITQEESGDFPVFISTYEKWEPNFDENISKRSVGKRIKEKLYLKNQNKYWLIFKIETQEEVNIN
jgi:hypothetical protein